MPQNGMSLFVLHRDCNTLLLAQCKIRKKNKWLYQQQANRHVVVDITKFSYPKLA